MPVIEMQDLQAYVLWMLQLHLTNWNARYMHWISMHVCYTCTRAATQPLLSHGQQISLPLSMFDYVAQVTSRRVWNQAVMSVMLCLTQLACLSQDSCLQTLFLNSMFVTVAPGHLVHRLQLRSTSMHFFWVTSHQQVCLKQLELTCKYIYSCLGWTSRYLRYTCLRPTVMSPIMLIPDKRAGKHNCTRPSGMYVTD